MGAWIELCGSNDPFVYQYATRLNTHPLLKQNNSVARQRISPNKQKNTL
jgi:hypothetical protein